MKGKIKIVVSTMDAQRPAHWYRESRRSDAKQSIDKSKHAYCSKWVKMRVFYR
jgi:hypothetical protein